MHNFEKTYQVIVVGAGHSGCEAALASARIGCKTLLVTINLDNIAQMSCNPAIGGLAKGQLVKEIDALGGEMAKAIDATGIQFRTLNTTKGPAVRSSRAQADMFQYKIYFRNVLEKQPNLKIIQGMVEKVLVEGDKVIGIQLEGSEKFFAPAVVVTTGTFMRGVMHIGLERFSGGRVGDPSCEHLSESLESLGFELGRLKTGTCPRLDVKTIDFSILEPQYGDVPIKPFSFDTEYINREQLPCYITYTNEKTHDIIRSGLDRSPLFTGVIKGRGPRYCPSIEDKVVKFADKPKHRIFLEPVGVNSPEIYPNGISTSLPFDIQEKLVHSIKGLERATILRPGYAIEYDFIKPTQLKPSLESKGIKGLFFAGQINGTSGYEEAGAQGIIAGINAANFVLEKPPLILDRSQAYIGVMIDDLVTKGTDEPYRMFTSRAEYRLILREDNADIRLRELGYKMGLVSPSSYERFLAKKEAIEKEIGRLKQTTISPQDEITQLLEQETGIKLKSTISLYNLLCRPEISYRHLEKVGLGEELPASVKEEVEIIIRYQGYIDREIQEVERFKRRERQKIPQTINYREIPGLTKEVQEKLEKIKPLSLGQAMRIPGVTPASIAVLQVYLKKIAEQGVQTDDG